MPPEEKKPEFMQDKKEEVVDNSCKTCVAKNSCGYPQTKDGSGCSKHLSADEIPHDTEKTNEPEVEEVQEEPVVEEPKEEVAPEPEPESKFILRPITAAQGEYVFDGIKGKKTNIALAVGMWQFVGFLYKDGNINYHAVRYIQGVGTKDLYFLDRADESNLILHPTHVVLRKG